MQGPNVEIRAYREPDEAGVIRLWGVVFPDPPPWNDPATDIRRKRGVQPDLFLVALLQGEVVGTVMAGYDGHRGWIHLLAVTPKLQTGGVGRALMAEAERRLAAYGCTKVNLQVRASNPEVVAFYEKLGYGVEDRISLGRRLDRT